jgi:hypothetical protein
MRLGLTRRLPVELTRSNCRFHPELAASTRCQACGLSFCATCVSSNQNSMCRRCRTRTNFETEELARSLRRVVYGFSLLVVLTIGSNLLRDGPPQIFVGLAAFCCLIFVAQHTYRTATMLRWPAPFVWGVATLLPCLNVIIVLNLVVRATLVLRKRTPPIELSVRSE